MQGGLGDRYELPSGSWGRAPAANGFWGVLEAMAKILTQADWATYNT